MVSDPCSNTKFFLTAELFEMFVALIFLEEKKKNRFLSIQDVFTQLFTRVLKVLLGFGISFVWVNWIILIKTTELNPSNFKYSPKGSTWFKKFKRKLIFEA